LEHKPLILSPSPHVRDGDSTQKIMFTVVVALLPAWIASIYFFGLDAVRLVLWSTAAALVSEYVIQSIRRRPHTVSDGSAVVTGMILGLSLPPGLPSWMAVLGSVVAIGLGKHAFGGLGYNPFNPALVGRAFLTASFAIPMTEWVRPFDAVSGSTPLALGPGLVEYSDLFFGSVAGSLGETSVLAILLGGIFLFYRGVLDYRMPLGFVASTALFMILLGEDPLFHLFSGSLMFAAMFMVTCMVTTPVTPVGRVLFGAGVGLVLTVVRLWGNLPEGVTFAILLMNAAVPMINRWTRPRIYGQGVKQNA